MPSALLCAWFILQAWNRISSFVPFQLPIGIDARIYYRGKVAWLSGGNPRGTGLQVNGLEFVYAGTPPTTVLLAPAALLTEQAFTFVWLAVTAIAAVWIVRHLRLPLWWLLFAPLVEGMFSGNPQIVTLALLLSSSNIARALAPILKIYAAIPLLAERRWRAAAIAFGIGWATLVIAAPLWQQYLHDLNSIAAKIRVESIGGFSAAYSPRILVPTVIALLALARRDLRTAGWLAVPALWPTTQFHYSTMALPVITPLLAVLLRDPHAPAAARGDHALRRVALLRGAGGGAVGTSRAIRRSVGAPHRPTSRPASGRTDRRGERRSGSAVGQRVGGRGVSACRDRGRTCDQARTPQARAPGTGVRDRLVPVVVGLVPPRRSEGPLRRPFERHLHRPFLAHELDAAVCSRRHRHLPAAAAGVSLPALRTGARPPAGRSAARIGSGL